MSYRRRRTLTATVLSLLLLTAVAVPVFLHGGSSTRAQAQDVSADPQNAPEPLPPDALAGFGDWVPPVRQVPESYLCGPDALGLVLRKWGDRPTRDELASLAGTTRADGTTLAGLRAAAQARGVSAVGVELDYLALQDQVGRPNLQVIAHVDPGHYYWVRLVNADGVALQDQSSPAARWMARAAFEQIWTGRALLLMRPAHNLGRAK